MTTTSPMSTAQRNKIRVLIAKPGLDGHDRGAKVIARALRDAGFEVIYTGLHQTPEMIVQAAVQEDVHVIGISVLSGAHNALVPEVIQGVRAAGLNDTLVLVGGIIPEEDFEGLKAAGTHMVFTPGTALDDIINYIDKHAPAR
jgi:methylmalonyl-CoA mutase C-terminal domain/subunit